MGVIYVRTEPSVRRDEGPARDLTAAPSSGQHVRVLELLSQRPFGRLASSGAKSEYLKDPRGQVARSRHCGAVVCRGLLIISFGAAAKLPGREGRDPRGVQRRTSRRPPLATTMDAHARRT